MKRRTGGMGEDLRQGDDATDDYFREKQYSDEEQCGDHQKQRSDEEQQREPVVQVGHERHGGEGCNAMFGEPQKEQHGDHQKQHSEEQHEDHQNAAQRRGAAEEACGTGRP
ncbi:hypothetical protein CBR_g49957 [Chara braunii]|uniref:Uncharacterized protein n=1 Tax=Chara braunii TaxID=69332 RepID=A0A388K543_CHABU|nr:hypothetical protein CBR_g49957 [Chara braunii]|eukprot:GBG65161.1 hypothetical protein CBR_g49957 [Chara braunii]